MYFKTLFLEMLLCVCILDRERRVERPLFCNADVIIHTEPLMASCDDVLCVFPQKDC